LEFIMLQPAPRYSLVQSLRRQALLPTLLSSLLVLTACGQSTAQTTPAAVAVEVGVVTISTQDVKLQTELPGRTVAFQTAEIRPQVGGIIVKRQFTEGGAVSAGDALYQIDPASFAATVQSAKASVAKAEADLQQAKAKASRYQQLIKQRLVSQQDFDEIQANFQQRQAEVAAAKAQLTSAQIQLDYSSIKAPISGQISKSSVTAGALVSAGQATALATIAQLDPIYVEVTQSSAELLKLKKSLASGALGQGSSNVRLTLEDGSQYPLPGQLQFAEVTVDASTGSVVLRAQFANPQQLLLPGMYVRATIDSAVKSAAVLAPQRGISRNAKGEATAMVVNKAGVAELRLVNASRTIGDQWLIETGLSAGEQLIVEGLQKIRPGSPVKAVPFQPATTNAAPVASQNGA
jgi:membrane fusion protein (multidrug efflux system)